MGVAGRIRNAALAASAVGVQVAAGGAAATNATLTVAGVLAVLGGVTLVVAPAIGLLTVLPAAIGHWRVGPTNFNLSVADVALGAGFLAALPFVDWQLPRLRAFVRVLVVYLGFLAIPVLTNASSRTAFEWGHRAFLVGCALAVGVAIQARGLTRLAFRLYAAMAVFVAVVAIIDTLGRKWIDGLPAPAYPLGMQKNPAALLIGFGVLLLIVAPHLVAVPRALRALMLATMFVGILACQSRGTAIALVVVLAFWLLRTGRVLRSPLALVGIALMVAMAYVSFNALFQSDDADSRFNSVNSRLYTYDAAMELWRDAPLTGAGLKYWRDPAVTARVEGSAGEPHNLVVAALGESGVIGLAGLVVLLAGSTRLLGRGTDELVMLGGAVLWAKAVASVFDIFWVAGTMTVPWIVIGVMCAADGRRSGSAARTAELTFAS